MKVVFEKKFLKDILAIHDKQLKHQLEFIISEIEEASHLSSLHNLKKMNGHKSAYRLRIGNYRLGFFFENHTVICTRLLHRKDIYKRFP